jgi:outer membrane protein assembly factor BamE
MKSILFKIKPKSFLVVVLVVSTLIVATSCKVPGMHRPSLQQGNLLTQDMVNELEPGMTKEQVEFVLGRPVHLNTFNIDHWDYVYTFEDRRGNTTRRHLSVKFENDVLVEIGGDYKPSDGSEDEDPNLNIESEHSDSMDEDPFQSPTQDGQDTD